ncbi:MAG: hypothetical protein PHX62_02145, partial [Bacilli bacterium]|nr:hypothetical protein [Bacilli bacterium]
DVSSRKVLFTILFILGVFMFTACDETDTYISNFKNLLVITTNPKQYEKLELALYEKEAKIENEGNPFDYNYFKILGEFRAPSGEVTVIPAFWYQHYQISLNTAYNIPPTGINGVASFNSEEPQGLQMVQAIGSPHYRFRLKPTESGEYSYVLSVYKNGVFRENFTGTFEVGSSSKDYRGVIEVDSTNNRNFTYENGESFIPIGQNLAWYTSSTRQAVDYEVWFTKMAEHEMNMARIWLADWGFALHTGSSYNNFSSRYAAMARLDYVVQQAEVHDIKFLLALNHHGQFSSITNPLWDINPWNKENGGPCATPLSFFKSEEVKRDYQNQLLYLIARFAYTEQLFAWELFNEIGWVDNYTQGSLLIKSWHNEMANFLKANDPYHHMVTTSDKGKTSPNFYLDSIDFACPHSYDFGQKNVNDNLPDEIDTLYEIYNKPILYAELGINYQNGVLNYQADPTGIHVKQGLWAGMMGGGAGGAMNWWWDSYIHPYNLYSVFDGAGRFSKLLNLNGEDYKMLKDIENIEINNTYINILGYSFQDRIYGYLFDKTWSHNNYRNILFKSGINLSIPFPNGNYTLCFYDTDSGEEISSKLLIITDGIASFEVPDIKYSLAFIIEEV